VISDGITRQLFTTIIGKPESNNPKFWNLFGSGRLSEAGLRSTPAEIGWAIESPLFYLQEAERTINLNIITSGITVIQKIEVPIEAYISTDEGWVKVEVSKSVYVNNSVDLKIIIPAKLPPFLANKDLNPSLNAKWPVLKLLISSSIESFLYTLLSQNTVENIKITTQVKGYKNLLLYNSDGLVATSSKIPAFGFNPQPGSRLLMGINELRFKPLSFLGINYKWKGAPPNLGQHYLEYFYKNDKTRPTSPVIGNANYVGTIERLRAANWEVLDYFDLFPADASQEEVNWISTSAAPGLNTTGTTVVENREKGPTALPSLNAFPESGYFAIGFNVLVNNSGLFGPRSFGHDEYPKILSEIAVGKATPSLQATYAGVSMPNAPYTPMLEGFTLDYSAEELFQPKLKGSVHRFFQITPFGNYEPAAIGDQITLLPVQAPAGYLYLGIDNLIPPQNLTILFQLGESSADSNKDTGNIGWSYLSDNKWLDFDTSNIIVDQTLGLKTSGILELSIPANATINHTLMPEGLVWLRMSVEKELNSLSSITDLYTQVVTVVYSGDLSKKTGLLSAESIKNLVNNNGQIKKVVQPYSSFGGRSIEPENKLAQRIQERIRHRNRALNYWDFERLTLEQFPEIYKVKCLPCSDGIEKNKSGKLALVVVPEQRGKRLLEPRNNPLLLNQIAEHGQMVSQTGVEIYALNPEYEPVLFDFKVSFLPGLDMGYYQQLLNEELQAFVSPWAFDGNREIFFGTTIYRSEVIRFIESRDYVDFVTNFEMYSKGGEIAYLGVGSLQIATPGVLPELDDFTIAESYKPGINTPGKEDGMVIGDNFVVGSPVGIATVSKPSGILVSAPVHRVRLIAPNEITCNVETTAIGIDSMAVEIDFEIS
jgi:hypothetical protein